MKKQFIFAWLALVLAACSSENDNLILENTSDTRQAIYNGSESPTLYTSMSAAQQNAVVSICANWYGCFCTGAIISPHVVLTAAHCLVEEYYTMQARDLAVVIGPDNQYPEQVLAVKNAIYYTENDEKYIDRGNMSLDIAVLILEDEVTSIPPLPISSGRIDHLLGKNVQAGGYGISEKSVDNTKRNWTTLTIDRFVALGDILVSGNWQTGTAPGDSGSPLLYDFGNGPQVIGVLSTGFQDTEDKSDPNAKYIYGSNYTRVDNHEKWIRSFINKYDNQNCEKACKDIACGTVGDCSCGQCARGFECQNNKCAALPAGTTGICMDNSLLDNYKSCKNNNDCADNEICYAATRIEKVCVRTCTPRPCSPNDPNSYCNIVFYEEVLTYFDYCVTNNYSSCDDTQPTCTASDGHLGMCIGSDNSNNECLGFCDVDPVCEITETCHPYDVCKDVCKRKKCGKIKNCTCGECTDGLICNDDQTACVEPEPEIEEDPEKEQENESGRQDNQPAKKGCNATTGDPAAILLAAALLLLKQRKIHV